MTIGHCKHGEFILSEGCPQCIAERQGIKAFVESNDNAPYLPDANDDSTPETALALRPGEDVEVLNYHTEAVKLEQHARARFITDIVTLKEATDDLAIISKLKKAMEDRRKEYIAPHKAEIDAILETYKALMMPVLEAERVTKDKMLVYNNEQRRIRQEQEEINRKRQEAAEQEMRLKGELSESVNLVEVAPEPAKSISTDMGTSGQRMIRKWELMDMSQVPEEYKMLDSARITKVVKAGIPSITGIRIYEEPIITVTAR